MISVVCLAVSQVGFSTGNPLLWVFVPYLLVNALGYLVSLRLELFTPDFDLKAHRNLISGWRRKTYPAVDLFLPICSEPLEILHNTWTHVRELMERYPGAVRPFVLDDGASPEAATMAADFGFRYAVRPDRGYYKKAGNLRFGFQQTGAPYLLILDADFAPRADILQELLPYLEADPQVCIVQSPQFFRVLDRQNWIERGAGAVQELFYRSIQVARQRSGGIVCCGSCAVYRRTALDQIGGISMVEHSEDMYTGFELRGLGWQMKYVPVALSAGVCPDSAGAFHSQQYRWCMASLSLITGRRFWQTTVPMATRLAFISGFLHYLQTALFVLFAPLIPIVLLVAMPDQLTVHGTLWILPSVVYITLIFPMWHRAPYRLEAWAVRLMYSWAHLFAILDLLRGRSMGWQPTGSAAVKKNKNRALWLCVALWSGGTAVVWTLAAIYRVLTGYPPDYALVLSSGLFDLVVVGRVLVQPQAAQPTTSPEPSPEPSARAGS
jgi:cellulose synthase (UDP-forming)